MGVHAVGKGGVEMGGGGRNWAEVIFFNFRSVPDRQTDRP